MSKNTNYLSVVQGNDFILEIHVSKFSADNAAYSPYDMTACSQVCVFLVAVTGGRRYKLPVSVNGNILTAEIDGALLSIGLYGLELLFEDSESHSKRSYEPALLKIVRTNAEATYTQADFDSEDDCRLHMTIQANASFITIGSPTADTHIDATSYNAVSNSAVADAITNLQTQIDNIGAEILDPSSVYTKAETEALIDEKVAAVDVTDQLADFVSKEELNAAAYLQSSALDGLATQVYVREQIEAIPQPDMSSYVSKEELSQQGYITTQDVSAMGYVTSQDVSSMGYATTQYVTDQIANIPATDLSSYATKEEINAAGYITESDVAQMGYITAQDVSAMGYASTQFVTEQIAAIPQPDLSTYITETELNDTLTSYAKLTDLIDNERVVSTALNSLADRIESVEGDYVSDTELDAAAYLQADDLNDFATKSYVDEKISGIAPTDLSAYVSKEELNAAAYLQADDLNDFATKSYVDDKISGIAPTDLSAYVSKVELNSAAYLQADDISDVVRDSDLTNAGYITESDVAQMGYITANDVSSMGYATTQYVTDQIANIPATDLSGYVSKSELNAAAYLQADDISDVVRDSDLTNAGYVTTTALDTTLSSYVKVSDIEANEQVISTALNTLSDRVGLIENDYVSDDELADYATKSYVVEKIDELSPSDLNEYVSKNYLSQQAYLQADDISDVVRDSDLASAGYVTNTDLSSAGYVTDSDLASAGYVTNTDLSSAGYVTKTELNAAAYLQADDLANYVTDSDLASAGYVTKTELNAAAYLQADDLTDYVTDSDLASAGYVTNTDLSSAGYVTNTDLASASYVTNTALNTTLASYATKADVPYKFVVMSYADYTALATKDPNTFYCIPEE